MIRILVVEDHPLVLQAVKHLFNRSADVVVVGAAVSGAAAVDMVRDLKPDVVILDITLPDINGLDICPLFLEISPQTKVVFFSMHDEAPYIHRALRGGATGYVLKSSSVNCLLAAVKQVQKGKYYFSPEVNQAVVKECLGAGYKSGPVRVKEAAAPLPAGLSPREFQVLQLVLGGSTNKKIADLLCLSHKTVEKHRANIMEKAKARTPMDLYRFAEKNQVLVPDRS